MGHYNTLATLNASIENRPCYGTAPDRYIYEVFLKSLRCAAHDRALIQIAALAY